MQVQPYLIFNGRCDEALEFYKKAIGAEVTRLLRFKDSPDPAMSDRETLDKVMHASFRVGETTIFASDGRCEPEKEFKGFSLSISVADSSEAERLFAGLCDGGQIRMPLGKTFFSPSFGMLVDRFGVSWMIMVA
jgi:PhnB protein